MAGSCAAEFYGLEKMLNDHAGQRNTFMQRAMDSRTDSRQYFGGIDDDFRKEQKIRMAMSKDYTHENSCFNNSMPTYRSSFVIHPDWISESKINKTAMTKISPNGLRYGASKKS